MFLKIPAHNRLIDVAFIERNLQFHHRRAFQCEIHSIYSENYYRFVPNPVSGKGGGTDWPAIQLLQREPGTRKTADLLL